MPSSVGQMMLASTPQASTTQARAKAAGTPKRAATPVQIATDGAAARPNTIQITGSSVRITGTLRTIATMNVAVIT